MTVAAIIPHWNRRDLLDPLFTSLHSQTRPFDEIILIDNGSTDDSADLAERHGANVLLLGKQSRLRRRRQPWYKGHKRRLDRDPQQRRDPRVQTGWNCYSTKPTESASRPARSSTPPTTPSSTALSTKYPAEPAPGAADKVKRIRPVWNQPRQIRMAPMTAAIFRKSLFDAVGLLDENFGSYLEDVDFGIRCALAGFQGAYIPAAVAYHRGSATWGAWNKDTVKRISRNQILLTVKHFGGQPRWPIVAGQMLWGLVALRHFRGVSWLRGKISGWKTARALYREKITVQAEPSIDARISSLATISEAQIFALQQQTGFDRYWRAYFWLLPRSL